MTRLVSAYLRRPAIAAFRNRRAEHALRYLLRPGPDSGLVRLGTAYGGWWVPERMLKPGAVAYCAGAGEDVSFDLELFRRGCHVTTFDPTPRAVDHLQQVKPESENFRFVPVGWWHTASQVRFYSPSDPLHVSHSVVNLQATSSFISVPVEPVHQLMKELGDHRVDLIKMDIEGAEYAVIEDILVHGPRPTVWCIEFDQPQPIARTLRAARKLRKAGYELVKIESFNFTFVLSAHVG